MAEPKHTPGPWTIRADGQYIVGDTQPVCDIRPTNPSKQANAKLIAAAPDLLAACKAVLANLTKGSELDAERLRLVIEKAEGTATGKA